MKLEDLLVYGLPAPCTLKDRLIDAGYLTNICEKCGQPPWWDDEPLVLQLDHISGDRLDNHIHNLRILCPNCHSQTETFAGRNRRR